MGFYMFLASKRDAFKRISGPRGAFEAFGQELEAAGWSAPRIRAALVREGLMNAERALEDEAPSEGCLGGSKEALFEGLERFRASRPS